MAQAAQSALPRPARRRSRQGRGMRRADCREARCEPAYRERTPEGIVAGGFSERETRQAMDVLQARRSAYCETENGHSREDLTAALSPAQPRAKTPLRSRCRNAGPA